MQKKHREKTTTIQQNSYNRKRILNPDMPFAIKEAYVKLRTNLMFCMTADKQRPCKVFAITSAKPSEGKSLTAANLAVSYALLNKRTLLIDADMRKPKQRRTWKINVSTGLCDFLANIAPLEISRVEGLPLDIICTGTIPPNPSELLASDGMKQLVAALAQKYDYIVLDTPPINTVADAQIISTFVDGVVIVARSGDTTTEELQTAMNAVHRAEGNLCGVILNDLNMKSVKYSYRYKYGNKYGYQYLQADSYGAKQHET